MEDKISLLSNSNYYIISKANQLNLILKNMICHIAKLKINKQKNIIIWDIAQICTK